MSALRAFIAVPLPLDAIQVIRRFIQAHEADLTRVVEARFVPATNLHVTMRFLGDTAPELRFAIRDVLAAAAREIRPLAVRIAGFGAFPNVQRARVLWVGFDEPTGALERMQRAIENGLVDLGFDAEDKPFRAHITIARVKSTRNVGELSRFVETHRDEEIGATTLSEVALFESRLRDDGPIYRALERCPL
ncbi:MAG: RNA 2',3'-cyclic phosphodiesterase [Deltaproteobacteria bacterium]|nr:RNA 2',3'-cyclic phosphodiesterase [Deltaproteobacteria bacterium]